MATAAVLLAAGAGSRFEGPDHKLRARLDERTVFEHALAHALAAGFDHTVVVTGAVDLDEFIPPRVVHLRNRAWADGQATSLAVALDWARSAGRDAVVVAPADQPFLLSSAWRAVGDATTPIAVATYDGRRRNPVRLAASVWPLMPRTGDEGARGLMTLRPELVGEIACDGNPADIDTLEDLHRWS